MPPTEAPSYAGQRVLVTGATGFIGCCVAAALARAGAQVALTARNAAALTQLASALHGRVQSYPADLSRPGEFTRLHNQCKPAVVFNLAGYGVDRAENDPALLEALNARLPQEMASAIADAPAAPWPGLRLVHCGTGFEYGPVNGPVSEESPARPTSDYGRTKLDGTRHVLEACARRGLRGAVVRLFVVYGPGEHPARLLPSLLRARNTDEAVPMTAGQQRRDFTFVADAADALLRMGMLPESPGVLNVATGTLTSVREFAETAGRVIGLRPEQLQFGALPYRADEVAQGAVDTAKLQRYLQWQPSCSIAEGIRRTLTP